MNENYIKIGDANIFYEDSLYGDEVLLCIHGFISSSWCWHPLIAQLTKDFRVIAIDLPGFGKTIANDNFIYTLNNYGKTVVDFVEKLKLQNVHLVGHSLGGQIALQAANINGKLFNKLFLIAASAMRKRPIWIARALCYVPNIDEAAFRFYFQDEVVEIAIAKILSGGAGVEKEVLKPYIDMCKKREVVKAVIKLGKQREDDLIADDVKNIKNETYLLWGREDRVVTLDEGKYLNKCLSNSTLTIIEHCGHLPMEEYPSVVLHHLYSFFCPYFLNDD